MQFEVAFEARYGVSLNGGMVLCSLSKVECLTSGEISSKLGITNSNASKVIATIEKLGYIKRNIGTVDKRKMCFQLTERGAELLRRINNDEIDIPEHIIRILK